MKTTAYITDCCNELMKQDDVVGVSLQADLIDKYESFKTIPNPEKADAHYCVKCYTKYVTNAVNQIIDRKNNEEDYIYYMKVHAYNFKQMVINRFIQRK